VELNDMRLKIQGGTTASDGSLCLTCRFSMITRGSTPDEEIIQCQASPMQTTLITFRVTSCSAYFDARQPTYMQMLDQAWILQPASKKRQAGFVRGADLPPHERSSLVMEMMAEADE
jgi:hypothetical protein